MAEGPRAGPRHRLRPLAACRPDDRAARGAGRAFRAIGRQSAGCRLGRPARTAHGRGRGAPDRLRGPGLGAEAGAGRRRPARGTRGGGGAGRPALPRLAAQHPRRRPRAYAARARLRAAACRCTRRAVHGPAQGAARHARASGQRGGGAPARGDAACAGCLARPARAGRCRGDARLVHRLAAPGRRRDQPRRGSLPPATRLQEPGGTGGRARRAPARRGGDGALPRLVRRAGAQGRAERDLRRRASAGVPPRGGAFPRRILPRHQRRRARTAPSCITA